MQGIYIIKCNQEEKVYTGSSVNIKRRWSEHKRRLAAQTHHCEQLQLAWDACGDESFCFEVVEEAEELVRQEQFGLDKHSASCYNTNTRVHNPMTNPDAVLKASGKHYSPFLNRLLT